MIRSMTGFARHERSGPWGTLTWELRTVNHRYLEIGCRLPEELRASEGEFRQTIGASIRRGKTDCTLNYRAAAESTALEINHALVAQLVNRAREIAKVADNVAALDPLELLRWPGVVSDTRGDLEPLIAAAREGLAAALTDLTESRLREGARMRDLLAQRCVALLKLVDAVTERLPDVRARIRTRLTERLAQLQAQPDTDRLEQELVILAQKMDVDEELDRLRSHVVEIRKALDGTEASGRRLDFLMQELNREANTLSSKSQDAETTRAAVEMKVLIEQMREQIQNVE
jgi:uncharacterized protein (TIGR00255 family)